MILRAQARICAPKAHRTQLTAAEIKLSERTLHTAGLAQAVHDLDLTASVVRVTIAVFLISPSSGSAFSPLIGLSLDVASIFFLISPIPPIKKEGTERTPSRPLVQVRGCSIRSGRQGGTGGTPGGLAAFALSLKYQNIRRVAGPAGSQLDADPPPWGLISS